MIKARFLALGLFATVALASHAEEPPKGQWRLATHTSLFDLTQNGYSIVAVTSDPPSQRGAASVEMFFLQKGNSMYKCMELHANDIKSRTFEAIFNCWELVGPYAIPK
jgi:hypothetical protein